METPQTEEINRLSNYFVGKVVTMLTASINHKFREEQMMDYFVGRIDYICELGIWTTHPMTLTKNFYTWTHLIGFAEEQVLKKDDPNYEKLMEEYKKHLKESKGVKFAHEEKALNQPEPTPTSTSWLSPPNKPPELKDDNPFVDIDALSNLAKQHKNEDKK